MGFGKALSGRRCTGQIYDKGAWDPLLILQQAWADEAEDINVEIEVCKMLNNGIQFYR